MSFKLLAALSKFGKFFATIPPSIPIQKRTWDKTYTVAMFTMLTTIHVASLYFKNFFLDYIHIKVALCFLNELSLNGLHFYCSLISGWTKIDKWKELIGNLAATTHLEKEHDDKEIYYLWGFISVTVLHCLSSTYVLYRGVKLYGVLYVERELADHILIFLDLFYKFVMCVILKLILLRYEGLKRHLSSYIETNQKHSSLPTKLMKKVEHTMGLLKKTVDIFNELFAWPIFLIISYTTLEILNAIDFAMFYNKELQAWDNVVLNAILLIWIFLDTVALILMCDSVVIEGSKIVSLTHDLRWSFEDSEILDNLKFEEFTSLLERNMPEFSAAGFFAVGRWTILDLLGTVVTFLIVMIQFGN